MRKILLALTIVIVTIWHTPAIGLSEHHIKTSPRDNRSFKGLTLDNGMRVILVSDKAAEHSAAAMMVAVGMVNDPADREGLAHFLEHMLFMGNKKYPNVDDFFDFIKNHGGMSNASTGRYETKYFFNVLPQHFSPALDRFAQFFKEPLFAAEYVDRERNAVDSEYKLYKGKDNYRVQRALALTMNPKNPATQFNIGDLTTLDDNPKKNILRDDLIKFHQDYYGPQRMHLVVVGPQELQELKQLVLDNFNNIPKRELQDNVIAEPLYTKEQTGIQINIQTEGSYQELLLQFPVPSQLKWHNTRSIEYLSHLLARSGPGSLEEELKTTNYIYDLGVSIDDTPFSEDTINIGIELTDKGLNDVNKVVEQVYAYIKFLRSESVPKQRFNDLKMAGERDFVFADNDKPLDLAVWLSSQLRLYPYDNILTESIFNQTNDFNPKQISKLLEYLEPNNMRMALISDKLKGDKYDPKSLGYYSVNKFSRDQLVSWYSPQTSAKFSMPTGNRFMPINFSKRSQISWPRAQSLPQEVHRRGGVNLWHKQDFRFKQPRQVMHLLLTGNNLHASAANTVAFSVMVDALKQKLYQSYEQLKLAGVSVNITSNSQGLILSTAMYSDKQLAVLEELIKIIQSHELSADKFKMMLADKQRDYENFHQQESYAQAIAYFRSLVYNPAWSADNLLTASKEIDHEFYQDFCKNFYQDLQLKSLMIGNLTAKDAINLANYAASELKVNAKRQATALLPNFMVLADNAKLNYSFDSKQATNATVIYYQSKQLDDKSVASNALLNDLISNPLFNDLRTQQQLGYVVAVNNMRYRERAGQLFIVESPNYDSQYVNARINDFILKQQDIIAKLKTDDFNKHKDTLIAKLQIQPSDLSEEANNYWSEIVDGTYRFNFEEQIAKVLASVTLEDVVKYYSNLLLESPKILAVTTQPLQDFKAINWQDTKKLADYQF